MSKFSQDPIQHDHRWMKRAIELARLGFYSTKPSPNVGCVIVKDGQSVGEGFHPQAGQPHAEVFALRQGNCYARRLRRWGPGITVCAINWGSEPTQ